MIRITKKLTAILLFAALLSTLFSCGKEQEPAEVITDKAMEYVNGAMLYFTTASCRSDIQAGLEVSVVGADTPLRSYMQSYKTLMHNSGEGNAWMVDVYSGYEEGTLSSMDQTKLKKFSTCYLKDGTVYHNYDVEEEIAYSIAWERDDFSGMGLYSISNSQPSSFYATKKGNTVRVNLNYLTGSVNTQDAFIVQMLSALFEEDLALQISLITFSAQINAETGAFDNYSIKFTATSPQLEEGVRLSFVYTERFYDYGTAEQIPFPADLEDYKPVN